VKGVCAGRKAFMIDNYKYFMELALEEAKKSGQII
jgi:hypothetical protein